MALKHCFLIGILCAGMIFAPATINKALAHAGHSHDENHTHDDMDTSMEQQRRTEKPKTQRPKSKPKQFFAPPARDPAERKNYIYRNPSDRSAPKPHRIWNN